MKVISNKKFSELKLPPKTIIENIHFEKCEFGYGLLISADISNSNDAIIIRNCTFIRCTFHDKNSPYGGLCIGDAIIEDILIEDCKTKGAFGLTFYETKLKNVVLKGNFAGNLTLFGPPRDYKDYDDYDEKKSKEILRNFGYIRHSVEETKLLNASYRKYYESVDVAIDISQVKIEEFASHHLFPNKKIKYQSLTQAYINKDIIVKHKTHLIKMLENHKGSLHFDIYDCLKGKTDDCLLVAGERSKKFNPHIELIRKLREEGVLERTETAPNRVITPKKKLMFNNNKKNYMYRVTNYNLDHGDFILLANNAKQARLRVLRQLDDTDDNLEMYVANKEKEYNIKQDEIGEKIFIEQDLKLIDITK